ncbi:hypothetical protein [Micromonospora sp. AMSO31t]|uniref:hypothetical protein n=1 Tax=Micromonospora sp. AMSO31t TaxID=2650566 RepID=UPI001CECBBCC|nr:hypothetical protein [Micromonospora sp. AMSO31t]
MPADPGRDGSVARPEELLAELTAVGSAAVAGRRTHVGFPVATDIDYSPLAPLFGSLLNNIGDPWTDPDGANHTKRYEREVLDWFGDLFRAPAGDRWGYLTSGGTEGNLYGLYLARARLPEALVYHSADAHYSLPKCVDILGLDFGGGPVSRWRWPPGGPRCGWTRASTASPSPATSSSAPRCRAGWC